MKYDQYGVTYYTENDLVQLLYQDPTLDISKFLVENPEKFNNSVAELFAELPKLIKYRPDITKTVEEFELISKKLLKQGKKAKLLDALVAAKIANNFGKK
jgi:hypothetical protein